MSAHTPGPWLACTEEQPVCYYRAIIGIAACGDVVQGVKYLSVIADNDRRVAANEWVPNARLIAAAPDLLSALDRMLKAAGEGCVVGDVYLAEAQAVLDRVRGAP